MANETQDTVRTITITVPSDYQFGNKVNGEFVNTYPEKWDNSWLLEIFRYGHRKINDSCKADEGHQRLDMARVLCGEMNEGKPFEGRSRGGSVTMSSLERITMSIAKGELKRRFQLLTKVKQIADMTAANPKVAAYFEGKTWIDSKVSEWCESEAGIAFDAIGQAKAQIADTKALAESVSLDDI